jgi:glycosyltransferase involved in cell wall biosynthesis
MRILHTEWSDAMGGQEKRILAEAVGLSARGHYVALICRRHSQIKVKAEQHGIDTYTLPMRKLYDAVSIMQLITFLKKKRFDIVNTHSGVDSWIGGIASKIAGVPVLVRTRHLNIPLKRSLLNFIHYLPDMYITCGENMRETLVRQCNFPPEKVISIPTGVQTEFFHVKRNPEAKLSYGLDKDAIVITNVGIFRRVKGHEVTLKAVKMVINEFPKAKFLLVGDGPDKTVFERMAKEMGIAEHVLFTGFIDDVAGIYSFTNVAILTSWSEGLPQSLLQAMAAGVPVIATKVGGVPEVVLHEESGLLIKAGDHAGLAEGIIRIINHPELAVRMTGRAKEIVLKGHSMDSMLDSIEGLYQRLLRGKYSSSDS